MMEVLARLGDRVAAVSDIYAAEYAVDRNVDSALLKLQEEPGELTQVRLRLSGRGRGASETARAGEAADVLRMLLLHRRRHGVDLGAAVQRRWLAWLEPVA